MSISVFFSMVVDFISFSQCKLRPPPATGAQREQLQTDLPWDLIQAVPHAAFATSLKPQIPILVHADWSSRLSLVSGATTGLAPITTKRNHHNKFKYLFIFQLINSKVTKSSAHFGMSSFKEILLIFHPTCWIDLHHWNLNSPADEWSKYHPKRSSFVIWILNYLYELNLTLQDIHVPSVTREIVRSTAWRHPFEHPNSFNSFHQNDSIEFLN